LLEVLVSKSESCASSEASESSITRGGYTLGQAFKLVVVAVVVAAVTAVVVLVLALVVLVVIELWGWITKGPRSTKR
jgi:hypothetical protein